MTRPNVINGRRYPVDLADGRVVPVGGVLAIDMSDEAHAEHLADGRLVPLDAADGADNAEVVDKAATRRRDRAGREADHAEERS